MFYTTWYNSEQALTSNRGPDSMDKTPRRTPMTFRGKEFDAFVFATIGEDSIGMMLGVASALDRQDVDPWRELPTLQDCPGEAAIRRRATFGLLSSRVYKASHSRLGSRNDRHSAGSTSAAKGCYRPAYALVQIKCRRCIQVSDGQKSDVLSGCVRHGSQHRARFGARRIGHSYRYRSRTGRRHGLAGDFGRSVR